ncbi:4-hydroxy-tetrahydrodipicolinate reductase [Sphingobium faniae]|nr:4-hydroxy-tetrahydrodipicolinate reductase [Sphingobium faniae]
MKRYRIAIWGPGGIGRACIREILRLPHLELVAVLAYNPSSNGKDVGTLIGGEPTGVLMTTDPEMIFATPLDCVLYTGAPPFDDKLDNIAIRLLESGRNVICSTAFFYPPYRGEALTSRLEAACKKGGASIHGTGENPGFIMERLGITLTGFCNHVERMTVREAVNCARVQGETLRQFGFGSQPEDIDASGMLAKLWQDHLFVETLGMTANALFGRLPDRIEHVPTYTRTDVDLPLDYMTIPAGAVAAIRNEFLAYLDQAVRLKLEINWYLSETFAPFPGITASDHWKIEIEGRPCSLRMDLEALASLDRNEELMPNDPTIPAYYATAAVMTQAIPVVCAADPGIVYPTVFTHATADFASLGTRRTLGDR